MKKMRFIDMMAGFEEIVECIDKSSNIAIAGHINPDGDAIGACCAMALALKSCGKNVTVFLEDFPDKYCYISGKELISSPTSENFTPQLFISLDCGDKERLGQAKKVFDNAYKTINIDHHRSNSYFAQLNYVNEYASSTCEIVFDFINKIYIFDDAKERLILTRNIASNLYGGIIYDTGGFRHTSTSAKTMKIVSMLMGYEIPFTHIYDCIFQQRSFQELKIMGKAILNAKEVFDGDLVYSVISSEEMKEVGVTVKELDSIISYIKSVKTSKVAIFIYEERKNEIKVSLRSENDIDVCAIAQSFGGGGHKKAAGFNLNESLDKAVHIVIEKIGNVLQKGE